MLLKYLWSCFVELFVCLDASKRENERRLNKWYLDMEITKRSGGVPPGPPNMVFRKGC